MKLSKAIRTVLITAVLVSTGFLSGCIFLNLTPTQLITVQGKIILPANMDPSEVKVISSTNETEVNNTGSFSLIIPDVPWQLLLAARRGKPILMGYLAKQSNSNPSTNATDQQNVEINAQTTALALVLMHPLFWDLTISERIDISKQIMLHPEYNSLVEIIKKVLTKGQTLLDNSTIYEKAVEIAESVYYVGAKPSSPTNPLVQSGVSAASLPHICGNDVPWIEDNPPNHIKIVNPKCVYYVAGFYDYDTGSLLKMVALDNRDFSWTRLGLEPNTRRSVMFPKGKRVKVVIDKGGGLLDPERRSDEVVMRATEINVTSAILKLIDIFFPIRLAISEDDLLGFKKTLGHDIAEEFLKILSGNFELQQSIDNPENIFKLVKLMFQIVVSWIINKKEEFCYWLYQEGKVAVSEHEYWKQVGATFSNILKLVKLGEYACFYYDWVFAQSRVEYAVQREDSLT